MCLQISDMPPAFGTNAGPAGKTDIVQYVAHGPAAGAVAGGVDNRVGYIANVRPAAQETSEVPFLVAPCRDFDGACGGRVRIGSPGRVQRLYHAERATQPAPGILGSPEVARHEF